MSRIRLWWKAFITGMQITFEKNTFHHLLGNLEWLVLYMWCVGGSGRTRNRCWQVFLLFRQNCKSVTDLLPLIYRDVIPSGSGTGGYGNATTRTCIRITPNSSAMSTCDWRSCNRATFWVPGKGKRACIAALPDQCMTDRLCLRSSLRLVSRGLRSNYLAKVRTISPFHTWPLSCSPIALSSR